MVTRVSILGATGSVGRSTADILVAHRDRFAVEAVAGGRDAPALADMAKRLGARFAAISDERALPELRACLGGTGIAAAGGEGAVMEAALRPADIVVASIVGAAGVRPTHAAVQAGRTVALANKESLVCAGAAFMRDARAGGATLLPLDSEHNAIFQALGRHRPDEIEQMVITASGGPFRTWPAGRIATARREEALAHPNWSMGAKITIDSASLMNKGLELIEAHHLFGVSPERLGVVVHPQSIVHGLVSFSDGSVVAGLALPDMRVPIAHCLGFPERLGTSARRLDLASIARLDFEAPDLARFPALRLAMEALEAGAGAPTVLNAANEVAVAAFLGGRLRFGDMAPLCEAMLDRFGEARDSGVLDSVEAALALDAEVRRAAEALVPAALKSAH
ncbi:1-deoxy-D-xylulose-5-phosphate reductoisomerase [Alsobacter soli]|uniref:1-deoxy-D-xylulose 5-phosphate reductoisomerase n=1 Tax=Alsobacter soli TaxID=2109933 RepID=A0A2T1HXN6_9HYPH|nr:1-deoxy-D-xylulose-5-phosphate reductoisomerase [Alsobacter soli]PSC06456.1 1-deoxy-D-xylulose-5-phosphate reductoisomerase [Alsobacter soli]